MRAQLKQIGIIGDGRQPDDGHSAIYMGARLLALDPAVSGSRGGDYRGSLIMMWTLRQLADRCDVLTYEFENVDAGEP